MQDHSYEEFVTFCEFEFEPISEQNLNNMTIRFWFQSSELAIPRNNTQTIVSVTPFRLLHIKCQEILSWHLEVS